jgi:hypothetical protein
MEDFIDRRSAELMILALTTLVLGTLLLVTPRLLRARLQGLEFHHLEQMKALEVGRNLPRPDNRSLAAGRTATLVPMVVICAASTVTCFLVAYKTEPLFSVSLAVWSVAGVVSLAAITGGVALMGRLAQLQEMPTEEEIPENPLER